MSIMDLSNFGTGRFSAQKNITNNDSENKTYEQAEQHAINTQNPKQKEREKESGKQYAV